MNLLFISLVYLLGGIGMAIAVHWFRLLRLQLAAAKLEAARLARHAQRLEMVLAEAAPDMFAHAMARSDMEWQQASARLAVGEVPVLFPLEGSFAPISPLKGGG